MAKRVGHKWEFAARFRRRAFGWKSQPPIQRLKQAVAEIKKVARTDPALGAEGAVLLLERLSPALERVDSSSGSIGTAVCHAIQTLVPIIAEAPADPLLRAAWLERLFEAHANDDIPYIESLADHWGELCGSSELASAWADRLMDLTRVALAPKSMGTYFHGTTACLSALYAADRHAEIVKLVPDRAIWSYKIWAVKALAKLGKRSEALRYAEASREPWAADASIDRVCEEILLSAGLADEAYSRYGLRANTQATYLGTFRAVCKKYPHKRPRDVLADLVTMTPGDEGKWFAAAKDAGLYEEALELAARTPCDPRTLARAARDFATKEPQFAVRTGLIALHWLALGYGYEITGQDVRDAYTFTIAAAQNAGLQDIAVRVKQAIVAESPGSIVSDVLGRELGLPRAR